MPVEAVPEDGGEFYKGDLALSELDEDEADEEHDEGVAEQEFRRGRDRVGGSLQAVPVIEQPGQQDYSERRAEQVDVDALVHLGQDRRDERRKDPAEHLMRRYRNVHLNRPQNVLLLHRQLLDDLIVVDET